MYHKGDAAIALSMFPYMLTVYLSHAWSAAVALMDNFDLRAPPLTVTSSYRVDLLKPAPVGQPLAVRCEVQYCTDVDVEGEVTISTRSPVHEGAEITCAIGQGSFKKIGPLRSFDAIL